MFYFADKVPEVLPATSTTITQCLIRFIIKNDFKKILKETQISIEGLQEKITKIDELQAKIDKKRRR